MAFGVEASPPLQAIETYLNNLRTVTATFQQTNSHGLSTGRFYMWRPGLMRLEYDSNQELIIADGTYLTHSRRDLDEVSSVAIDATPAAILLQDTISFKDMNIISFEKKNGHVFLSLSQDETGDDGVLTLVLNENPLLLLEWIICDAEGHTTRVVLDKIKTGLKLPKDLFVVK